MIIVIYYIYIIKNLYNYLHINLLIFHFIIFNHKPNFHISFINTKSLILKYKNSMEGKI